MEFNEIILARISTEAGVTAAQVRATVTLLEDQATVPFIARYRKEVTGNLDEVQIREISERHDYYKDLVARRETILKSIEEQGKLTEEFRQQILSCYEKSDLEDLYLPYKPKRKTKATVAVSKGLEPLAGFIWSQSPGERTLEELADTFVSAEKEVASRDDAIEGALHIIAEWVAENGAFRKSVRELMLQEGVVISKVVKGKEEQKTKFEMYYDFHEPVAKIPSHRMLAIRRGVKEQILAFSIEVDAEKALRLILGRTIQDPQSVFAPLLEKAIRDSYERLLNPSIQAEVRAILKERSDSEAIKVFEANLSNLLLAPPAGVLTVMGIDPGFRTGCKVVVVDGTGKFLEQATIYPTEPKKNTAAAEWTLYRLIQKHNVQAVAVGNGTASRETDSFVKEFLRKYQRGEPFSPPPRLEKKKPTIVEAAPASISEMPVTQPSSIIESLPEPVPEGSSELMAPTSGFDGLLPVEEPTLSDVSMPLEMKFNPVVERPPSAPEPEIVVESPDATTAANAVQEASPETAITENPSEPAALPVPSLEDRHKVFSILVNESGASVYSASEGARREFPKLDVTVRGAISIARRLQDPLAELVKIHPKSIGVGQYQHDVDQKRLKEGLEATVESGVNHVGVDLNTASYELLRYVSGLNRGLAKSIVDFRNEAGRFFSRSQLLKVPGFGDKTFEQAAGFLRIKDGENPLDETAVHPESYSIVERIAESLGVSIGDLIENSRSLVEHLDMRPFADEKAGLFTLNDIRQELLKPGRDPREQFVVPTFRDDVKEVSDLKEDMVLEGTVTNVTNFGAFVDIGVHQDGLVHVSELSNHFVKDPREAVRVGEVVKVKVIGVDVTMKRISLSMKALLPKIRRHRPIRNERRPEKPVPTTTVERGSKSVAIAPAVLAKEHVRKSVQRREVRLPRPAPPKPKPVTKPEVRVQPRKDLAGEASKVDPAQLQNLSFAEKIRLLQAKFGGIR